MTSVFINTSEPVDPNILRALGQVTVAWAQLDFVLRAACKRVEQVSWESQQGKDIWELSPHSKLMKHIRRRLNECCLSQDSKDALGRLLSEIGCGRSDGLYGQRNQAVHSFLWLSPDGSPLAARVGHSVTRSQKVGEKELSELANKIARVSEQMLDLTYPTSDITIEYSQSTADVSAASWMKP